MKKLKVIFGVILVMILMSLVCSCGSVRYIPIISHDSVYVNKIKYDSIYQRDSIYLAVKGDTVYINKLNWYQNLSVWGFSIILGAIIIYIILKIKNIKLPL